MTSDKKQASQLDKPDIVNTLEIGKPLAARHKRWITITIIIIMMVGIMLLWIGNNHSPAIRYKTAEVIHDTLIVTITATGRLEPVNQVDVGSEISGTIKTVEVIANDIVRQGQTLAILNTDQQETKVNQAKAALQLAKSKIKQAEATLREKKNILRRSRTLEKSGMCSAEECDASQAAYDRAEAELLSTRAQAVQAQAFLDAEQTILAKATIHSPINGIVLKRAVEPGQTVAASLQTPVLFVLAEDLTKMELHVGIDEADVGQVKEGQDAIFTVDAYPKKIFPARITEVHFASQTVDGVVTYETALRVDNSALLLRPGMTATADVKVKKIENALLVPNAALRFTPLDHQKATTTNEGSPIRRLMPRQPTSMSKRKEETSASNKQQRVWMLRNRQLIAIPITVGATDGFMTEVVSGDIEIGAKLLINTMDAD